MFCAIAQSGLSQSKENYYRFLDSVDIHIDTDSEISRKFLDSIPKPAEKYIKGRVGEYYADMALIHDGNKELLKFHRCNILALKYAKEEENFCIAGQACIDLFSDVYLIDGDTSAFKYIDLAEQYFSKCDDPNGLVQVEQMYAYVKFLDGEFEASNELILPVLQKYKTISEDAYYYMFALYMLSSNYYSLHDKENADYYFKAFKTLENNTTIAQYNYYSFESGINLSGAEYFFEKKQIDSTKYYLNMTKRLKPFMGEDVLRDYYKLYAEVHKHSGRIDASKAYVDSLIHLEQDIHKSTVDASFQISDDLLEAETELIGWGKTSTFSKYLALGLLVAFLLLICLFYFVFYRRHKAKIEEITEKTDDLSIIKSNNEQLTVKVQGLEEYINNLKKEVKAISIVESIDEQKARIKALYKNLHINSATILDKSDSHLELINDLNIGFFKKIDKVYPQLNKSEVIICYYILIGFSNKEIAVFLNATLRSVESKRYRISKKIDLNRKNTSLLNHLQETFKDAILVKALIN
ncbi:helix-turn-helix transcriptional regulator [Hyunsoonleella rubra]|uniref:Helix-turn-helix transcriptional regulator n=1 Tax=Hyunsoonleella rubra TaxID=1737062 RepID=A0ABW5THF8_9FLAO